MHLADRDLFVGEAVIGIGQRRAITCNDIALIVFGDSTASAVDLAIGLKVSQSLLKPSPTR